MGVVIKDRRTAKCLWVNIEGEGLCFTTDLSARQWESWVRFWVRGRRYEFSIVDGFSAANEMRLSPIEWGFADGFSAADEMHLSPVEWGFKVCMFGCEGEWECSRVWTLKCLIYDHKSSIKNSISTCLYVEKSPGQMFVTQDLEY